MARTGSPPWISAERLTQPVHVTFPNTGAAELAHACRALGLFTIRSFPAWLRAGKLPFYLRQFIVASRRPAHTSSPTELFHRPARVPDLRHVLDLSVLEVHDVGVIRPRALARRRHGTAFAAVPAREDRVGADAIPLLIERERLHLVASIRDEDK